MEKTPNIGMTLYNDPLHNHPSMVIVENWDQLITVPLEKIDTAFGEVQQQTADASARADACQNSMDPIREALATETDNRIDTLTVSKWRQGAFGDTSRTNQIEYYMDIPLTGGKTIYYGGMAGDFGVSTLNLNAYRADGTRVYVWSATLNGFIVKSQAVPTDIAYIKVVLTGDTAITPLSVISKAPKLFVSYTNMPTEAEYVYGMKYMDAGEIDSKIREAAEEADTRLRALDGQVEELSADVSDISGAFELVSEALTTETDNRIDTLTVGKWRQGAFGDTSRTNQIEYYMDIPLTGGKTIYYGGMAGDSGVSTLNLNAYRADGTRVYVWSATLNDFTVKSQAVPTDIAYIKVVLTGDTAITPQAVTAKRPKLFVSYANMSTEAEYVYGVKYMDIGELDSKIGKVAEETDTKLRAFDGQITELSADVSDISDAFELVCSRNLLDPSTVQYNKWIYLDGRIVDDTNTFIFGQIPCKKGDVIYITALNASGNFMGIAATNFRRIVCYKSDGTVSSDTGKDYTNGYTVTGDDTAYFMFAVDNANKGYQRFSVTINDYPTNAAEIDTYTAPYYALPLDKIVSDASLTVLPKTTIDCWGDSMTERGTPGTPYPEILQDALGDGFTVNNYGMSSQSSGEVAMRFGTNEVYVTLEGNQIPATVTPVKITDMLCTRGDRWTGRNMVNFTPTKSVPCRLNGVPGQFSRTAFSDATFFTRDTAGDAVPVQPQSRLWCDNYMTEQNICIFWAGKNDTAFAAEYIVTGTVDCIYSMTNAMPHNHYVVLPVIHSIAHPSGDVYYRNITAINNKLAELHPDNYLDIQSMLMKNGLQDAGLTPTEEDTAAIKKGTLPPQLMGDDGTHPNETCRKVIAQYILDFLVSKKWI